MNAPIEPLEPDVVDELWSAELDGEFDAAAADLGLSADAARARLAATPGANARRQALELARDALRAPVAPLPADARAGVLAAATHGHAGTDELARRRSRRPSSGRLAGFAVAAAAILLVVGIAVSIATTGSDHSGDSSASRAADTATSGAEAPDESREGFASTPPVAGAAAPVPVHDFGVVGDEDTLRTRVGEALGLESATSAGDNDAATPTSPTAAGVTAACLARQTDSFGLAGPPTLRGPVDYKGTPAEVLVFAQGEDSLAITVATGDCHLLVSALRAP